MLMSQQVQAAREKARAKQEKLDKADRERRSREHTARFKDIKIRCDSDDESPMMCRTLKQDAVYLLGEVLQRTTSHYERVALRRLWSGHEHD